jgi:K+-sensing histidine kinase KdpD
MIEKIHKTLVLKYTVIIACILLLGFTASYIAYRHNGVQLLEDTLHDYLEEELWEAEEVLNKQGQTSEIHEVKSDIQSLYNFTYWIADNKIIHAEIPEDDLIAEQLSKRLLTQQYEYGKIHHENIKHDKQKWYFMILKNKLPSDKFANAEVVVLANYTPIRKNSKIYIKVALFSSIVMILLAYILASFLVSRSMKYIEKSYAQQKQFVSDAAHELRTPLCILYSYAELLEHKPQRQDILNDIKDEIQQMADLVEKLLSLARYDNSKMAISAKSFYIDETLKATIKSMEKLYTDVVLKFVNSDKKLEIEADEVMIKQLLGILLENAAKYTTSDKKITIKVKKTSENVKLSITDNGIGIKEADLPHIFDRFWRAETSRHQKGLGLGLSLANTIVNLHNGKIEVQSKVGKGSTFEITLPLKQKR